MEKKENIENLIKDTLKAYKKRSLFLLLPDKDDIFSLIGINNNIGELICFNRMTDHILERELFFISEILWSDTESNFPILLNRDSGDLQRKELKDLLKCVIRIHSVNDKKKNV